MSLLPSLCTFISPSRPLCHILRLVHYARFPIPLLTIPSFHFNADPVISLPLPLYIVISTFLPRCQISHFPVLPIPSIPFKAYWSFLSSHPFVLPFLPSMMPDFPFLRHSPSHSLPSLCPQVTFPLHQLFMSFIKPFTAAFPNISRLASTPYLSSLQPPPPQGSRGGGGNGMAREGRKVDGG